MSFWSVFKSILPFKAAVKVPPEIQAKIDAMLADVKKQADDLAKTHNVDGIKARYAADIAAVRATAEHHIALIEAQMRAVISGAGVAAEPKPAETPPAQG